MKYLYAIRKSPDAENSIFETIADYLKENHFLADNTIKIENDVIYFKHNLLPRKRNM